MTIEVFMKQNRKLLTSRAALVLFVAIAAGALGHGQTPPPQPVPVEPQRGAARGDPIRQLNLTPEQREQIRSIRQQSNVERAAINQRVGEANRALQAALDSDNPDEAAVEQRVRDLAAAQADAMRMRILTEVKIRRVLTVEQRKVLRALQQQALENQRERLENREQRQQRREERPNTMRNQRNGIAPLLPRDVPRQRP